MKGVLSLIFALALLSGTASAAVIYGSVYDPGLDALHKAVITINTTPAQVIVSRNGTYQFTVPAGNYLIKARQEGLGLAADEKITVLQEGDFVLDLILFPDLGPEEELLNESFGEIEVISAARPSWQWLAIPAILAAVLAWLFARKRKKPCPKPELDEIVAFVRREGGRTTQKELRSALPYSEAKVSLMIAELESSGKLRKIRRGRGNIIIIP